MIFSTSALEKSKIPLAGDQLTRLTSEIASSRFFLTLETRIGCENAELMPLGTVPMPNCLMKLKQKS